MREQLKRDGVPGITEKLVDQQIEEEQAGRPSSWLNTLLMSWLGWRAENFFMSLCWTRRGCSTLGKSIRGMLSAVQDKPGVLLHTQTGTISKEAIVLPNYRCGRGSTSLESFQLHLKSFISGQYESLFINKTTYLQFNMSFYYYYYYGNTDKMLTLVQRNEGHQPEFPAVPPGRSQQMEPGPWSPEELMGIDYLYRQTERTLQDVNPDSERRIVTQFTALIFFLLFFILLLPSAPPYRLLFPIFKGLHCL